MAGCEGIAVIDVFLRNDQIVVFSTRANILHDIETFILEDERVVQNGPQIEFSPSPRSVECGRIRTCTSSRPDQTDCEQSKQHVYKLYSTVYIE